MALTKVSADMLQAGAGGIAWQTTPKTAAFTAAANEGYFVDTSSSAITVTLPSSPTAGNEVSIVDYTGTAGTNNITITSSNNINGSSNDVKIDYERGGVSIVYVDATQGWIAASAANETAEALFSPVVVDYLVVAGAGGGGGVGGGGGAGGYRTSYGDSNVSALNLLPSTNYTVTIGSGGAPSATGAASNGDGGIGANGSNSVFSTITSAGGGGGAGGGSNAAGSGGSGGGSRGGNSGSGNTPSVTPSQGNNGGDSAGAYIGGGGGGASQAGNTTANNGGNGSANSITGTSVTYAGGGGGGGNTGGGTPYNIGSGGTGGGADGGANAGTANTGGGGGGGTWTNNANYTTQRGGAGGSGVVIIRYLNTYTVTIGSGLTGSTATDGSHKVTTFTAGTGNISFS